MSDASPQDLAVSFRSFARRRREAMGDAPIGDGESGSLIGRIDGLLAEAARLMTTTPDPAFIADAIDAVPAKEWDEARLDALRRIAIDLGRNLRDLADQHAEPD